MGSPRPAEGARKALRERERERESRLTQWGATLVIQLREKKRRREEKEEKRKGRGAT